MSEPAIYNGHSISKTSSGKLQTPDVAGEHSANDLKQKIDEAEIEKKRRIRRQKEMRQDEMPGGRG